MELPGEKKKYKRVPLLDAQWNFPSNYELKKIYLIPLKDNIQNYDFVIVESLGWGEGDTAVLSTNFADAFNTGHGAFLEEGYDTPFSGSYNASMKVSAIKENPTSIRAMLLYKGASRPIEQIGINQVYGIKL